MAKSSKKKHHNWGGIGEAEVYGRGRYLLPGENGGSSNYKLKFLKAFTIETQNKGPAFIVDFEVMESDNDEIAVGQTRNWYQGMQDENIAFPAIKEFMIRLLGIDTSDKEANTEFEEGLDDFMEEVGDEDWKEKDPELHPLHGSFVQVECYTKKTRKGEDFTVHDWDDWDGED